ncbi:DNA internalization-related competence protein ComEC/Rec2 [Paraliobacillus sp. JSM ZJ581]|uniref:DNA internalization-related competence protein ComEC/Rec2 n=1 Tax=Paraliobacillus sp. JSM ZJ581 TaxID=3342118 RepID=UPI0035A8ADAD
MRGYWHLFVFASLLSIIAITFQSYFLYGLYFIWVYILYKRQRIRILHLMLLLGITIFTSVYYLPTGVDTKSITAKENYTGTITSSIIKEKSYLSFVFNTSENINIQLFYFPENESKPPSTWKTGASCELNGIPRTPSLSTNPGQFDYQAYLLQKGITKQLDLATTSDLQCEGENILDNIYSLREATINHISDQFSTFTSSWLLALFFGFDSQLDENIVTVFEHWNLLHLLAISGLHVGLISGFLYFLLVKTSLLSKEKSTYVILMFLFVYPFISGGAPSVWRASLMTSVAMILLRFRKNMSMVDILSIVFLVCILFNKQLIYQLGFQFSFLVTFSLVLSKKWFVQTTKVQLLFRISLISILVLLPLQLMHFFYVNPFAILLSIFIIPYFSILVMPLLFLLLFVSFILPTLSMYLDNFFQLIHQPMLDLITWIDDHLFFPLVIGEFPLVYVWIYYIVLIGLLFAIEKNKKRLILMGTALILCWIVWLELRPYANENGTVTMLDVGQGDAIVIELPYRKGVIMIDIAGTLEKDFQTSSDKTYQQVIAPFLYSKGINQVDVMILSHADHDHIGSLQYLLQNMHVKHIVTSKYFDRSILSELLIDGVNFNAVGHDMRFNYKDIYFKVIHPKEDMKNRNDNSLVILTKLGQLNWLFTGDISQEVEQELINNYSNMTVDVLKLAHHGSADSTSERFIGQFEPNIALISVGRDNRYGHPADEVLKRLESNGVSILRTDQQGAIEYSYKDNGEIGTFSTFLP